MSNSYAHRSIEKCTKDCLCLYVCPTGAADTENSIIDIEKCIGCGACFKACPSKAISMIPRVLPKEQEHSTEVLNSMNNLLNSKTNQNKELPKVKNTLYKAIELSNSIMAQDISREAGYMLPQGDNSEKLLKFLLSREDLDNETKSKLEDLITLLNKKN